MDVVILQWTSGYNFDIRNKKLLELTPFFFSCFTITFRTLIFHFLPGSCKKELTSLCNTTIWKKVFDCFKNFQQYCKDRLLLMIYTIFVPSFNPGYSHQSLKRCLQQ